MIIIDVRTAEEYAVTHANGAINFDVQRLSAGERPAIDKSEAIGVYCRTGNRSGMAKIILENDGYQVENLGGLMDLQSNGFKFSN